MTFYFNTINRIEVTRYSKLKKCDGKSVTDQTDRQMDRRQEKYPYVSSLLTAGDTKIEAFQIYFP